MRYNKPSYLNLKPNEQFKSTISRSEWFQIVRYLEQESTIKKRLCVNCGSGKLIDNNGEVYRITRRDSLEGVKSLVDKIKLINAQ